AFWTDPQIRQQPELAYVPARVRESWPNSPFTKLLNSIPPNRVAAQRRIFDLELKVAGEMFRAGVRLLAGTDTSIPYIVQGFSLHDELGWLVKAGLTPMESLQAATIRPAEYFGIQDSAGS